MHESRELLKNFSAFIRENYLEELAYDYINLIKSYDIPIMKLIKHLSDEEALQLTLNRLNSFLISLEEGTAIEILEISLQQWEQDKMPGISKNDIKPNDLILAHTSQRQAIIKYIPKFTPDSLTCIKIINALDEYYTQTQVSSFKVYSHLLKDVSKSVKVEKNKLKSLFINAPAMITILDGPEHVYQLINKKYTEVTGLTEDDLIGKSRTKIYQSKHDVVLNKILDDVYNTGKPYFGNEISVMINDKERIFNFVYQPYLDNNDQVEGIMVFAFEVTELVKSREELKIITKNLNVSDENLKQTNEKLSDNVLKLEVLNSELEAFTYSISHDLRSPLRAIGGFSKALMEDFMDILDEDGKHYLNNIYDNSRKMGNLIDDLLTFSRIGRKQLVKTEVNTNDMVNSVISSIKETIPLDQIVLKIEDLPLAFADYSMLKQVFVNLIANAVKFSKNIDQPVITVGASSNDKENIYFIKDNGAGFNMKYIDKLFGVFQRLHGDTEFEGTGVGLALVHRIIDKHSGRVWAEAKVNEGATFYFSLPKE